MHHLFPGDGQQAVETLERIVVTALISGNGNALTVVHQALSAVADPSWRTLLATSIAVLQADNGAVGESLASLKQADVPLIVGLAHLLEGYQRTSAGRTDAVDAFEAAVRVLPADAHWALGLGYLDLAYRRLFLLQAHSALLAAETARAHYAAAGSSLGIAQAHSLLATIHMSAGSMTAALEADAGAEAHYHASGVSPSVSFYRNRAVMLVRLGRFDEALGCLETGLERLGPTQSAVTIMVLRLARAEVLGWLGRWPEAHGGLTAIEAWASAQGDVDVHLRVLTQRATLGRWQCQPAAAQEAIAHAEALWPQGAPSSREAGRMLVRAALLTDAGNWEGAASLLTTLVATLDSGSSHWYLARVYAGLARVRRAMGELPAAVLAEQTCRRLCDEAGYDLRLIDERCPHPPVTGPVLRCRWFGRLEAILPDGEALIAAGKGTKTLLLLANLHVHAEGLDAKAAALHLFGGSSDPDHAMTVLVARLRQRCQVLSLPPLVQIGGGRLTLGPDWQIDSDYDRFLEARSRSRTATNEAARVLALQAMITLYQGHLFGKLHQEDWSRSAHDVTLRYWQQAHEALQQVCDTEEAWSLALALAETNLAIDPLGFKANRRKLTLLVRMGEPVVAMALWQDLLRRRQHPRVRHLIEALRPVAIELSLEPS